MALRCPVCKQMMVTIHAGPVEIDVCKLGCRGLWFDAFELQAVVIPTAELKTALCDSLSAPPRIRPLEVIHCPRCVKPLKTLSYRETGIMVDFCYGCAGYFLDAGELRAIYEACASTERSPSGKKEDELWELEPDTQLKRQYLPQWRPGLHAPSARPLPSAPLHRNVVKQEAIIDTVFAALVGTLRPFNRRTSCHHTLGRMLRDLF